MEAVDLLKAAKAGNTTGVAAAEKKWNSNADQIATFLSTANPNWSKVALKSMLDNHLKLTLSEAVAILGGKYSDGIAAFDKVHQQAMVMSDAMADGIVKQFTNKFSNKSWNDIINFLLLMILLQPKEYRVRRKIMLRHAKMLLED